MFRGLWWAHDGAPAHRLLEVRDRLLEVRDRLNETFGENVCDVLCGVISRMKFFPDHS